RKGNPEGFSKKLGEASSPFSTASSPLPLRGGGQGVRWNVAGSAGINLTPRPPSLRGKGEQVGAGLGLCANASGRAREVGRQAVTILPESLPGKGLRSPPHSANPSANPSASWQT